MVETLFNGLNQEWTVSYATMMLSFLTTRGHWFMPLYSTQMFVVMQVSCFLNGWPPKLNAILILGWHRWNLGLTQWWKEIDELGVSECLCIIELMYTYLFGLRMIFDLFLRDTNWTGTSCDPQPVISGWALSLNFASFFLQWDRA